MSLQSRPIVRSNLRNMADYIMLLILMSSGLYTVGAIADFMKLDKFMLRSSLSFGYDYMDSHLELEEYYSRPEKRTRINYRKYSTNRGVLTNSQSGSYLYDESGNELLSFNPFKCEKVDMSDLWDLIKLDFWQESSDTGNLLNASARVAYEIFKYRSRLKKSNLQSMPNQHVEYSLEYNSQINMLIYYHANMPEDQVGVSIPKRVKIRSSREEVWITFGTVVSLDEESKSSFRGMHYDTEQIANLFAAPTTIGCSEGLQGGKSEQNIGFRDLMSRFSFEAHLDHDMVSQHLQAEMFVAYDGTLSALRVDMEESNSDIEMMTQVFDFNTNRGYNVLRRAEADGSIANSALDYSARNARLQQQCVAIDLAGQAWRSHETLSYLLTGSDNLVYMGRGTHRGIPVKIYESIGTKPPYWLEQPVNFYNEQMHSITRQPSSGKSTLTTVIYLAESDGRLLKVSIHEMEDLRHISLRNLEIHNFVWDLSEPESGNRAVDMFSLTEDCANIVAGSPNQVSEYEMLLESTSTSGNTQTVTELLMNSHLRNIGVLSVLHDAFRMPIVMIADLETHIVPRSLSNSDDSNSFDMVVKFKFIDHTTDFVELRRLGMGRVAQSGRDIDPLRGVRVHSFQACYMLAAHHKSPIEFGYNPRQQYCFLSKHLENATQSDFLMEDDDISGMTTEIYGLKHKLDFRMYHTSKEGIYEKLGLSIVSRKKSFPLQIGQTSIDFYVKILEGRRSRYGINPNNIELSEADEDDSDDDSEVPTQDNGTANIIGRISGFKFDLKNPDTVARKIVPSSSDLGDTGLSEAMSFEKCGTACINDLDCKSFSFCVGLSAECIISSVQLRSQKVLDQIRWDISIGATIDVNTDKVNVTLKRHFYCSIYNQNSLYFFRKQTNFQMPSLRSLLLKSPVKVSGREECAFKCTQYNALSIMRRDYDTIEHIGQDTQTTIPKKASSDLCTVFNYLDRTSLATLDEEAQKRAYELLEDTKLINLADLDDESEKQQGFCFRGQVNESAIPPPKSNLTLDKDDLNIRLEVEQYIVDELTFFEVNEDVRLLASYMDNNTQNAVRKVTENSQESLSRLNQQDLEALRHFIKHGENNQVIYGPVMDMRVCAKICFWQSSDIWPSCKSFDLVVEFRDSGSPLTRCYLNSITLKEAKDKKRDSLILKTVPKDHYMIKHFEPRIDLSSRDRFAPLQKYVNNNNRTSSSIGYPIVITLGLLTGFVSSYFIHKRLFSTVTIRRISAASNIVLGLPYEGN